jgi:hypothetical protein
VHSFLRVTEVGLDGCQNDGRRKYFDIDACKFVVNQPAINTLFSAALSGHETYNFLHKRSFPPPNHFSSHLNLTLSHSRRRSSPANNLHVCTVLQQYQSFCYPTNAINYVIGSFVKISKCLKYF